MTLVTLRNKTGRAKVIMLDHPAFRHRDYGFRRREQTVLDQAKDGTITRRQVRREEPGSISLPPRGEVPNLHPAIKNCAQVKGLLARNEVEIVPSVVRAASPESEARSRPRPARGEKKGEGR